MERRWEVRRLIHLSRFLSIPEHLCGICTTRLLASFLPYQVVSFSMMERGLRVDIFGLGFGWLRLVERKNVCDFTGQSMRDLDFCFGKCLSRDGWKVQRLSIFRIPRLSNIWPAAVLRVEASDTLVGDWVWWRLCVRFCGLMRNSCIYFGEYVGRDGWKVRHWSILWIPRRLNIWPAAVPKVVSGPLRLVLNVWIW